MNTSHLTRSFRVAALIILLAVAACEVGPDYEKPAIPLPEKWISTTKPGGEAVDREWWKNFNDPVLTEIIAKAAQDNPDLQIAKARIAEARGKRSAATASLLPSGDVKGGATRVALPDDLAFPSMSNPLNIYQAQFDASWELDLFGGRKRDVESAEATMQAAEASRDDVIVSLLAEVARTYIDIRQYQAQLKVTEDTIKSNNNTIAIVRQRVDVGGAPRIELTQAQAQAEQTEAQLPYYRNLLAQAEFSMDALLGDQPGTTHAMVVKPAPIPVSKKNVALSAPAAVIANRPDIRIAERKLAAATAQQGVAVAKFFPDISLSGFFGLINTAPENLLTAGSTSWMVGGSVLWPILSYGTLSANLDVANAQQQESLAAYRKTIIVALADVEKSLNAYTEQDKFREALGKSVKDDRHAMGITEQRYKEGLTSFLEVLDARRTLYSAESQMIEADAKSSNDLVAVYKSLGGGWR